MASGRSGPEASQFASIVLFALPREAVPLRKTIEAGRHGSGVSIAVSGIGAANSRLAAERLLRGAGTQPVQLVIAGFAGALTPAIAPGDVMVATRVMCVTGGPELLPDNRLMEAASWAPTQQAAHRGALISAPVVLTSKDEKQRLHASSDADAVDMESYAAACAAVDGGVPWLCVRAITDRCDENLPIDFNRLGPAASSPSAVGRFAAVRPRSWPGLVLLGRNSSRAARSLAVAIHALLIHLQAAE